MFDWLKPKAPSKSNAPPPQKDKAALIKEAMANARHARETIGSETLDRVLDMMQKKKAAESMGSLNPSHQARQIIEKLDKGHVADHLKDIIQHGSKKPPTH